MEGKKRWALFQDCRGVSEVYGQLLMMSIVVIAFSTIGATVFSDEGAVKPEHIPHTDLQENFNRSDDKIQIVHSGGEAIDKSAIKIIVSVDGVKKGEFEGVNNDFKIKNPDGKEDDVFTLGDYIEINNMSFETGNDIEIFFIDTPSQQVIQKAVLQRGFNEIPKWITPHPYGSIYSDSTVNGGWQSTDSVAEINDGLLTDSHIPKNASVTENYTFGIDADEMGISNSFTKVILRIIYQAHDNSPNTLVLRIFNGSQWTQIAPNTEQIKMPEYNNIQESVNANPLNGYTGETTYNITKYIKTASELEKLEVSFSVEGHADDVSEKTGWVDFLGIHVE